MRNYFDILDQLALNVCSQIAHLEYYFVLLHFYCISSKWKSNQRYLSLFFTVDESVYVSLILVMILVLVFDVIKIISDKLNVTQYNGTEKGKICNKNSYKKETDWCIIIHELSFSHWVQSYFIEANVEMRIDSNDQ